jgi:uncharacterized protein YlaN (UPF0358 family)
MPCGEKRFPIWKVIELGSMAANELKEALRDNKFGTTGIASEIMDRIHISGVGTIIELVKVALEELLLGNDPTREQVYDRAKEWGLNLVPAEVGPQLRLQYPDQPDGEELFIGMVPMCARDGNDYIFLVERDGESPGSRLLFGYRGDPGGPDVRWVFTYQHVTVVD